MIKRHYLIQLWLLGLLFFVGFGMVLIRFEGHQQQVHQFIHEVKHKTYHPVEPIPSFKPLEPFNYPETEIRPSPFQKKKAKVLELTRPNANRRHDPLEAYPLDALKFTGVLEEGPRRWALIRLPDSRIAQIKIGEYMGKNDGKVVAVTENSLIIEEQVLEEKGWVKRTVTFRLDDLTKPEAGTPVPSASAKPVINKREGAPGSDKLPPMPGGMPPPTAGGEGNGRK